MPKPRLIKEMDFNGKNVYLMSVNLPLCLTCCLLSKEKECMIPDNYDCKTHGGIWSFEKPEEEV